MSTTLWDWAARAYAQVGVEALCLSLQDEHGQNVPLLIWAAWAARTGRPADPARLAEAAALARTWETAAVEPLRAARRALKQTFPGVDANAREMLRQRIKADELAAERLLLEALEGLTPDSAGVARDPASALRAASAAWCTGAPTNLLERLGDAFSRT